jgi:hypothetical protein
MARRTERLSRTFNSQQKLLIIVYSMTATAGQVAFPVQGEHWWRRLCWFETRRMTGGYGVGMAGFAKLFLASHQDFGIRLINLASSQMTIVAGHTSRVVIPGIQIID